MLYNFEIIQTHLFLIFFRPFPLGYSNQRKSSNDQNFVDLWLSWLECRFQICDDYIFLNHFFLLFLLFYSWLRHYAIYYAFDLNRNFSNIFLGPMMLLNLELFLVVWFLQLNLEMEIGAFLLPFFLVLHL